MTTLTFARELGYPGHSIRVPIRIHGGPQPFTVSAILDTGAAISVMDSTFTSQLGIVDYTSGAHRELRAANGQRADGYIHSVRIEIWGNLMVIPIAFTPRFPTLLGMEGFFDQLQFGLVHAAKKYYV